MFDTGPVSFVDFSRFVKKTLQFRIYQAIWNKILGTALNPLNAIHKLDL